MAAVTMASKIALSCLSDIQPSSREALRGQPPKPPARNHQPARTPSTWIDSFTSCLKPYFSPKSTPKSLRLKEVEASAPQTSFLDIGFTMHLNWLMVRVTGLVTPCSVNSPSTAVGAPS